MKPLSGIICLFLIAAPPAAAEFCSEAPKGQPCTPDPGDATDTAKDAILTAIRDAMSMQRQVNETESAYLHVRGNAAISAADRLKSFEEYRAKKMGQDRLYKDAITKTLALYHIQPDGGEPMPVAESPDPNLKWTKGISAHWDPQATDSGPGVKLGVELKNKIKGETHYQGRVHMDTEGKDGIFALTLIDGRVLVLKGTFNRMLQREPPDPGLLASVLYHESRHFTRLSHESKEHPGRYVGWTMPDKEEVYAYDAEIKMAPVFGLSDDEVEDLKSISQGYADKLKSKTPTSYHVDPEDERKWKEYYEKTQVNLEAEYAKLQAEVAVERQRQEQQVAEDAERRRRERERAVVTTAAVVKECGFEPHFERRASGENFDFIGYQTAPNRSDIYSFPRAATINQLKVSLMLARTCSDVNVGGRTMPESVAPPCNDGLEILNAHAGDVAFLDGIRGEVTIIRAVIFGVPQMDRYVDVCIEEAVKAFRFPLDFDHYRRIFDSQIKRNVKLNRERAKAEKKREEIEKWNREHGSTHDREGRERSGDDDSSRHSPDLMETAAGRQLRRITGN